MLIGIAIDPACFGPSVITDTETRNCAERILDAIISNAILICGSGGGYRAELIRQMESLPTKLGRDIQIRITEVLKHQRSRLVSLNEPMSALGIDVLRETATRLKADLVVCKDSVDAEALRDLCGIGIEVCELRNFSQSASEQKRASWMQAQRLDNIDVDSAASTVGAAVKYARSITILDCTLAGQAKKASERAMETDADRCMAYLEEYAKGAVYIVQQWLAHSPFANGNITLVTRGHRVNTAKYFDPDRIEKWIEQAIRNVDSDNLVGEIAVLFKLDFQRPRIFLERFIDIGSHCWAIQHGLDHFGKLSGDASRRPRVFITPNCEGYRQLVAEIMALPDAH